MNIKIESPRKTKIRKPRAKSLRTQSKEIEKAEQAVVRKLQLWDSTYNEKHKPIIAGLKICKKYCVQTWAGKKLKLDDWYNGVKQQLLADIRAEKKAGTYVKSIAEKKESKSKVTGTSEMAGKEKCTPSSSNNVIRTVHEKMRNGSDTHTKLCSENFCCC